MLVIKFLKQLILQFGAWVVESHKLLSVRYARRSEVNVKKI